MNSSGKKKDIKKYAKNKEKEEISNGRSADQCHLSCGTYLNQTLLRFMNIPEKVLIYHKVHGFPKQESMDSP